MVDITVTNTAVIAGSDATIESGKAGATIAAGKVVYKASATGKYGLADSNGASAEIKAPVGIALNDASDNQPLAIIKSGSMTMNAALTAGSTYFLSDTPGGICPDADVGAGETVVQLGIAVSTTVLSVRIFAPGVAR